MFEVLRISGPDSFTCARQAGLVLPGILQEVVNDMRDNPPEGLSWTECLTLAREHFLPWSQVAFPQIIDAIEGAAAGAREKGVNFTELELFTTTIEELDETPWQLPEDRSKIAAPQRCTDVVFGPPATSGEILVGHNNDLAPKNERQVRAVEWSLPWGQILTVGLAGLFPSTGINTFRVVLSGDEVSPTDNQLCGVPRHIVAWATLFARDIKEAVATTLHPWRASSYANLLASSDEVVMVEASATDHQLLTLTDGWLVHTNSYIGRRMLKYDAEPEHIFSHLRQARAQVLAAAATPPVIAADLKRILRDHSETGQSCRGTICRHEPVRVIFSTVINPTAGTVEATLGPPCQGEYQLIWRID